MTGLLVNECVFMAQLSTHHWFILVNEWLC